MLMDTGDHQMARQARLHPPPHSRRDQGGREHRRHDPERSPKGRRSCQEAGVVDHDWYDRINTPSSVLLFKSILTGAIRCLHTLGMRAYR